MISLLRYIDETFGSVSQMLIQMGWAAEDTDQLRAKLRRPGLLTTIRNFGYRLG